MPPLLTPPAAGPEPLHADFLALMPTVEGVARWHVRQVQCPRARADLVAEAVALAWVWYLRLMSRGKDPVAFPVTFAHLAARAAVSGRRVYGQEPARDLLSRAGRRRGVVVVSLPSGPSVNVTPFQEALADNTRSLVPDQVQFRMDFPAWVRSLSRRDRRLVGLLAVGHRTSEAAARVGLTPGRVSQLRREYHAGYLQFLAGRPDESGAAASPRGPGDAH